MLEPDAAISLAIDDIYWNALLASSFEYEPEFSIILRQIKHLDFVFFDCGANFGYWSILLSSRTFGSRTTLAIEAAPATYATLEANCALNHRRFTCLHAAIWRATGETVSIETSIGHSAAYIAQDASLLRESSLVSTLTLDDVARRYFDEIPKASVVKLDVEGAEIDAMLGARELAARDVLFFYEDHGADLTCKVTRFVLEQRHMNVYFCRGDGRLIEIPSVDMAARVKKQRSLGYNFFACNRGGAFDAALAELVASRTFDRKPRYVAAASPPLRESRGRRRIDDWPAALAGYKREAHLAVRRFHQFVFQRVLSDRLAIYFHEVLPAHYPALRELIGYFRTTGYAFVDAAGLCESGKGKRLFISFDDNYRSWMSLAQVLEECNVTATFFVNTLPLRDVSDRASIERYFDRIKHHGERMSLSKKELAKLAARHRIGCHSHSHFDLTAVGRCSLESEIDRSKSILEEIVGNRIVDFAYPFGMRRHFSGRLRGYCQTRGFETISSSIPGLQYASHRPASINRTAWIFEQDLDYNLTNLRVDGRAFERLTGRSPTA
jgi:FkbM family methyltransferase